MIPRGVEVYVGLAPIDLRWGFDRLCDSVREHIGRNARSGALFVFFGRRRNALKILFADHTGLSILYKRLDKGCYRLAGTDATTGAIAMSERELEDLLEGIDIIASRKKMTRH